MKVKNYEKFVANQAFMPLSNFEYSFIGLAGETGEVMEWLKKAVYRGNTKFTDAMLKSELGDVLHYVTRIALAKEWSLKDLMEDNVAKLEARDAQKAVVK